MATDSKMQSLSPSLTVQIGRTKITALICTSSWVSLMTQSLYDQLRVDSSLLKESTSEKTVNGVKIEKVVLFDALLCECAVELMVSVVEKCDVDLILGCNFLSKIESNFCINKSTFKWMHNKMVKISKFVTTAEKLRSKCFDDQLSQESVSEFFYLEKQACFENNFFRILITRHFPLDSRSYKKNGKKKLKNHLRNMKLTLEQHSSDLLTLNRTTKNLKSLFRTHPVIFNSNTVHRKIQQNHHLAIVEQNIKKPKKSIQNSSNGFQLINHPSKDTTKSKPQKVQPTQAECKKTPTSTIQDGWATVYVSTRRLMNLCGIGPPLGYYGVWWYDQCECNTIKGLPVEIQTMIGLNCRAVTEALKQAQQHGITRLRIVINRNEGLDLFESYARNHVLKKLTQTKCQLLEVYEMYKQVCMLIRKMDQVKFEHFHDNDDKSPKNLKNLRQDVHIFIACKDGLRDDRVPEIFEYVRC